MNQESKLYHLSKKPIEKPYLDESIFNSKIFIHLSNTNESPLNNSYTQESDNISELEKDVPDEKSIDDFLTSELIEEIDSPCLNTTKKNDKLNVLEEKTENEVENFSNILLPLAKNGYEFLPKNFKQSQNKFNVLEKNKKFEFTINYLDINKIKKKEFQERKGDWKCILCNNLNFAFRNKCNRCQTLKEKSYYAN